MGRPDLTFIDAFAGCGGLSLGLLRSGWTGVFAIEKDTFAFNTLSSNLLNGRYEQQFLWPEWLDRSPHRIEMLLEKHEQDLRSLAGQVTMIGGGPPCQGFSSAGRRSHADPRNTLIEPYLALVDMINPRVVFLENVQWIAVDFQKAAEGIRPVNYAATLVSRLSANYNVFSKVVNTADYGVPQSRKRFVLIAFHKSAGISADIIGARVEATRKQHLRRKGLIVPVSSEEALSDMELSRNGVRPSSETPGFREIKYDGPRTTYQRLMHDGCEDEPTDLRLANHKPEIARRFELLISQCGKEGRLNTTIGKDMREQFGLRKQAIRVLDPDRPAPTVTSMPDDLLHYSEARTLTVRETARLQSFPDWFAFRGKYTTGGARRRNEVPRFTQVANAIPPIVAEVVGEAMRQLCDESRRDTKVG